MLSRRETNFARSIWQLSACLVAAFVIGSAASVQAQDAPSNRPIEQNSQGDCSPNVAGDNNLLIVLCGDDAVAAAGLSILLDIGTEMAGLNGQLNRFDALIASHPYRVVSGGSNLMLMGVGGGGCPHAEKDEETEQARVDVEQRLDGIEPRLRSLTVLYGDASKTNEGGYIVLNRSLTAQSAAYLRDTVLPNFQGIRDSVRRSTAGVEQVIAALDTCDPAKAAEYRQGYNLILPAANEIESNASAIEKKLTEAYERLSRFLATS